MKTVHIEISGKVQGVFFRASAREIAKFHGLTGWIRNNQYGKVEALVTGRSEDIDAFVSWCKIGPAKAIVDQVICTSRDVQIFDSFKVIS